MSEWMNGRMNANCRSISVARAILRRCDGFTSVLGVGLGLVGSGRKWVARRSEARRGEEHNLENRRRGPSCGVTVSDRGDWVEKR